MAKRVLLKRIWGENRILRGGRSVRKRKGLIDRARSVYKVTAVRVGREMMREG